MLVFCFLAQPCYVEPTVARAYTAVRNMWRFLHLHPENLAVLVSTYECSMQSPHSLLYHFTKALKIFHLALYPNLDVGIGTNRFQILDVAPKDFCDGPAVLL